MAVSTSAGAGCSSDGCSSGSESVSAPGAGSSSDGCSSGSSPSSASGAVGFSVAASLDGRFSSAAVSDDGSSAVLSAGGSVGSVLMFSFVSMASAGCSTTSSVFSTSAIAAIGSVGNSIMSASSSAKRRWYLVFHCIFNFSFVIIFA